MAGLWIVHRDPARRAALARLAGDGHALAAAPGDRVFDAATAPDAVLLGLAGDFEEELEFAHRLAPHLARTSWLLVCEPQELDEARRLFDTLPAECLAYPPDPARLRALVRGAGQRRRTEPLSERRTRDALAARFARWFADLELPEMLRALDPHLARVPLLLRGEPGTGRGLLARYLHAFGGSTGGSFIAVSCGEVGSLGDVAREIERGAARRPAPSSLTICLEDVDRLPSILRQELRAWIELAPPVAVLHSTWLRWIGTAGPLGGALGASPRDLEEVLAGITVALPTLRERPEAISRLVEDTARAWAFTYGERPRRFSESALEALREYPWPGNLRELEAVVLRTLAADPSDPLPAASVRFGETPKLFVDAGGDGDVVYEQAAEAALPAAEILDEPPMHEADDLSRRFLASIAHEIRNPLVPIRTFTDLLPTSIDDPEFRQRFAARVGADVRRIEGVLDRMTQFAALGAPRRTPVDVSELLDRLLEARRDEIQARRLLVLKELDRSQPFAQSDPEHLELALEGLLGRVLALVPERGDLYLASKHHAGGLRGGASVRVLLRYHSPEGIGAGATPRGVSLSENSLDLLLAESIVTALGGRLTIDATDSDETVIVLDLPA